MTDIRPYSGPPRSGPWTFRCCVTAACTRCGTTPLDDDTGLAPHFDSPQQAAEELTRDWGWHLTPADSPWEQQALLCPACAAADTGGKPRPSAPDAADDQEPETAPWRERTGQPALQLPPNAAIRPAVGITRKES